MEVKAGRIFYILFLFLIMINSTLEQKELEEWQMGGEVIKKVSDASKDIVGVLTDEKLKDVLSIGTKTVQKLAGIVAPILTVFSFVMDILLFFLKPESEELKLMKQEFEKINKRFDEVNEKLDEVKNLVLQGTQQVIFSSQEMEIRQMIILINDITSSKSPILVQMLKERFINQYSNNYKDGGRSIADAILRPSSPIIENPLQAAIKYLNYDRLKFQVLVSHLTKLIIYAVEIDITYVKLKNNSTEVLNEIKTKWEKIIDQVQDAILKVDQQLIKVLNENLLISDVNKYLDTNHDKNHVTFSENLFSFLESKYSHREWLVMSYAPLHGWHQHTFMSCHMSHHVFRVHNRNIIVASVDRNSARWSKKERAEEEEDSKKDIPFPYGEVHDIFHHFDDRCSTYGFMGAFHGHHGGFVKANETRLITVIRNTLLRPFPYNIIKFK